MNVIKLFGSNSYDPNTQSSQYLHLSFNQDKDVVVKSSIEDKSTLLLLVETFKQSLLSGKLDD